METVQQQGRKSGAEAWSLRVHDRLVELSFDAFVARFGTDDVPLHRIAFFKHRGALVWCVGLRARDVAGRDVAGQGVGVAWMGLWGWGLWGGGVAPVDGGAGAAAQGRRGTRARGGGGWMAEGVCKAGKGLIAAVAGAAGLDARSCQGRWARSTCLASMPACASGCCMRACIMQ